MARGNNKLRIENTKITAFWDIMPCTVACDVTMSKMYCPYLRQTRKPCGKSSTYVGKGAIH
jgi:hypothetical protein